ncbi:hypothetical protein [Tsukamurella soli]|uniref:hypothetical protein n=1 Tax=Tsukamurella soli TaxID=644556 RepID=UPI0036162D6D
MIAAALITFALTAVVSWSAGSRAGAAGTIVSALTWTGNAAGAAIMAWAGARALAGRVETVTLPMQVTGGLPGVPPTSRWTGSRACSR